MKGKKTGAPASGTIKGFDLATLEGVAEFLKKHGLAEIEWSIGDQKIRVTASGGSAPVHSAPAPVYAPSYAPAPQPVAAAMQSLSDSSSSKTAEKAAAKSAAKTINSPFVGTFYRSPSPESAPYVKEGQAVKAGDVLCIVEAMKLMNEIEAEFSGKIGTVLVENGQPVEYGEPLFTVE